MELSYTFDTIVNKHTLSLSFLKVEPFQGEENVKNKHYDHNGYTWADFNHLGPGRGY
jgi:hypothetical protein